MLRSPGRSPRVSASATRVALYHYELVLVNPVLGDYQKHACVEPGKLPISSGVGFLGSIRQVFRKGRQPHVDDSQYRSRVSTYSAACYLMGVPQIGVARTKETVPSITGRVIMCQVPS